MYLQPSDGRLSFRQGNCFRMCTFGQYPGFIQTNLSIIPSEYADEFATFCQNNPAPCPLLFRSAAGQHNAPLLADGSDVRSDVSTYQEYRNGVPNSEPVPDLLTHKWSDMASFYLGCSYSFDSKLLDNGIVLSTPSMHVTNIPCIPSGPFSCNMVVTMRPIPAGKMQTAVELSLNMDFCHGAPIHIGNPGDIGLEITSSGVLPSDIKEDGKIGEGEVPCFWACGVTGNRALRNSKLSLSFSHYPGSMFITDILSDNAHKIVDFPQYLAPAVICTDPIQQRYVTVSQATVHKVDAIEYCISFDPGNRHTQVLVIPGELARVSLELSVRATKVGILVGFPLFDTPPAEENDGIAGAVYLARALQAIGAGVVFIVDTTATQLIECLSQCKSKGFTHDNIPFIQIGRDHCGLSDISDGDGLGFSHLIAIERPSPACDGKYYTMKARDISDKVGSMADVFRQAFSDPLVTTIGIGDGGNEVGMGKVKDNVVQGIPHGDIIAADVSAEFLVSCGVSNWGGLAIAASLYLARACLVHDRYRRRGRGTHCPPDPNDFLMSGEQDEELHRWVTELGFRDGCSGRNEMTVDALDYKTFHAKMLQNIRCHTE